MNAKKPQKFEPGSWSHLAEVIEATNRTIKDYLLRQHLSLWHPISTAPNNHDLELKVLDGGSSVVLTFPCGRTNAGEWINADLEAAIDIRPTKWRPWQKAKARKPGAIFLTTADAAGATHERRRGKGIYR
jgi:hypothetical protein